jgi:hypothetical protein
MTQFYYKPSNILSPVFYCRHWFYIVNSLVRISFLERGIKFGTTQPSSPSENCALTPGNYSAWWSSGKVELLLHRSDWRIHDDQLQSAQYRRRLNLSNPQRNGKECAQHQALNCVDSGRSSAGRTLPITNSWSPVSITSAWPTIEDQILAWIEMTLTSLLSCFDQEWSRQTG